jgi:NADH-quinone oxidoreductase subunit L
MADWLFLIPLAPLLAAVINYIFGRWWLKSISSWIAILAIGVSFVLSIIAFLQIRSDGGIITQHLYTWIPAGNFTVPVTLEVDQLVAVMLLVVTGVSLVVHIYSVGYMHGDPGY